MDSEGGNRGKNIEAEARVATEGKDGPGPSHTPEPVEMKSPPVQVMAGYDPNRIPSSVFTPTSPGEWSGASNESLFSIQMGNNSFSKDYAILYGKPPEFDWNQPQGELPRLDDWSNKNANTNPSTTLPPVMEVPSREGSRWQSGELSRNQSPTAVAVAAAAKPNPTLRVSDVSGHSNMSFAFPVLVSDSAKTDYSVRVAPEKPVSGPQKVAERPPVVEPIVPPQPQSKPQPQPQTKVSTHPPKRWFSCFSCSWPRFC